MKEREKIHLTDGTPAGETLGEMLEIIKANCPETLECTEYIILTRKSCCVKATNEDVGNMIGAVVGTAIENHEDAGMGMAECIVKAIEGAIVMNLIGKENFKDLNEVLGKIEKELTEGDEKEDEAQA